MHAHCYPGVREGVASCSVEDDIPEFSAGDEVVAGTSEWILASVIAWRPEQAKYEVEDAVDDEDTGLKK